MHIRKSIIAATLALGALLALPAAAQDTGDAVPLGRLQRFTAIFRQEQTMRQLNTPALAEEIALFADLHQSRTEDGAFVLGDPDAPITIVEFADWACSHCQEYQPTMNAILREYVATGQAKFEFRMFPTAGGQQTAYAGALAECAEEQQRGAFWSSYATLYVLARTDLYSGDLASLLADSLELTADELTICAQTAQQVVTDVGVAQAAGVTGTPALLIRDEEDALAFVTQDEVTYARGPVPEAVLRAVIEAAQG